VCFAVEEKRLTNGRLQTIYAEWLGNEEGWFRRRASQVQFRIARNDNDGNGKIADNLVNCFET
jgi:hypothetical protein